MPETTTADKMICPNCKISMNHHGDKLVASALGVGLADVTTDAVILEFHSCPGCGYPASRCSQMSFLSL
jgi:ribosomal protein S27AE